MATTERSRFATTRWSVVLAAGESGDEEARAALEQLASDYWYPLYAFARRRGKDPAAAEDAVQGFLAELIESDRIGAAHPARGRFRSFLLTSLRNHMSRVDEKARALKRGGGRPVLSLDIDAAEGRYALEPSHVETAERAFLRNWALALIEATVADLASVYDERGELALFEELAPLLAGEREADYEAMGARLDRRPGTLRVAAHRLRARYREALRARVAATLDDDGDPDRELRELLGAL